MSTAMAGKSIELIIDEKEFLLFNISLIGHAFTYNKMYTYTVCILFIKLQTELRSILAYYIICIYIYIYCTTNFLGNFHDCNDFISTMPSKLAKINY